MIFHSAAGSSVANNASRKATKLVPVKTGIGLGARVTDLAHNRAGDDVKCGDQSLRAVTDIFKLAPFNLPRQHRQQWRSALQRLHAGHFVNGNRMHTFSGRSRRLSVCRANLGALCLELRVGFGREPIADEMRLDR